MYQLAPSILAADFNCLGKQISQIEQAGVKWLRMVPAMVTFLIAALALLKSPTCGWP